MPLITGTLAARVDILFRDWADLKNGQVVREGSNKTHDSGRGLQGEQSGPRWLYPSLGPARGDPGLEMTPGWGDPLGQVLFQNPQSLGSANLPWNCLRIAKEEGATSTMANPSPRG